MAQWVKALAANLDSLDPLNLADGAWISVPVHSPSHPQHQAQGQRSRKETFSRARSRRIEKYRR